MFASVKSFNIKFPEHLSPARKASLICTRGQQWNTHSWQMPLRGPQLREVVGVERGEIPEKRAHAVKIANHAVNGCGNINTN